MVVTMNHTSSLTQPPRCVKDTMPIWQFYGRLRLRQFCGEGLAHGRALGHAAAVVHDPRQARPVDAVALQPPCEGEQIRVADRIALAHDPGPLEQVALDQV